MPGNDVVYRIQDTGLFFKTKERAIAYYVDVILMEKIKHFGYSDDIFEPILISTWKYSKGDDIFDVGQFWEDIVLILEDSVRDNSNEISSCLAIFPDKEYKDPKYVMSNKFEDVYKNIFIPLMETLKELKCSDKYKEVGDYIIIDIKEWVSENRSNVDFKFNTILKDSTDYSTYYGYGICEYCKNNECTGELPEVGTPCFVCKPRKQTESLWKPIRGKYGEPLDA